MVCKIANIYRSKEYFGLGSKPLHSKANSDLNTQNPLKYAIESSHAQSKNGAKYALNLFSGNVFFCQLDFFRDDKVGLISERFPLLLKSQKIGAKLLSKSSSL